MNYCWRSNEPAILTRCWQNRKKTKVCGEVHLVVV